MKKLILALGLAFSILGFAGLPQSVSAATCPEGSVNAGKDLPIAECNLPQTEAGEADLMVVISNIINAIIGIVGLVAVFVMILGGVHFITSQGDAAKVTRAKNTILYGVVGLVVAMLAFAIVNLVIGALSGSKDVGVEPGSIYSLEEKYLG